MSQYMTKKQKEEYISILTEMIARAKKFRPWIIVGFSANALLAVWCLGLSIYHMFFNQTPPPRFFTTLNLLISMGNAWLAIRGLNELERNKQFINTKKEELEFVSEMKTEN